MLYIPETSPDCYVSSIVALNIHSPNGTGDWHSAAALNDNAFPLEFYLYGKGQVKNTNHLLGNLGVIDGTKRLNDMGYFPEHDFSRRNKEEYESDFTPVFFTVPTKDVADFVEVEEFHNEELSEPYFSRMVNMLKKHYPDYDFSSLFMEFYIHINADDPAYSIVIFA